MHLVARDTELPLSDPLHLRLRRFLDDLADEPRTADLDAVGGTLALTALVHAPLST